MRPAVSDDAAISASTQRQRVAPVSGDVAAPSRKCERVLPASGDIDVVTTLDELLEKVRRAHDRHVQVLHLEIQGLRRQLEGSRPPPLAGVVGLPTTAAVGDSVLPTSTIQAVSEHDVESAAKAKGAEGPEPDAGDESRGEEQPPSVRSGEEGEEDLRESPSSVATASGTLSKTTTSKKVSRLNKQKASQQARDLQMQDHLPFLWRVVHSPWFDTFFVSLIVLSGACLAVEAQYVSFDVALQAEHSSASQPSAETWVNALDVLKAFEWIFGVAFLLEVVIKVVGLRSHFVRDPWNWLDVTLVAFWLYDVVGSAVGFATLPINTQILRLGRVARLLRLLRLLRSVRSTHFDSLYLITTALKGSLSILSWTCLMLLIIHMMLALLMNQILLEFYFKTEPEKSAALRDIYGYYGSFSRSLLTMFEITLANWPPACRLLVENVSPWFIVYALLHKMVLGFAVLGVVNGVFIQETFKSAALDDAVMVSQTKRRQRVHNEKMRLLFLEADTDQDGTVDAREWQAVLQDEWVRLWLASQDLNAKDGMKLWRLLDPDGDGKLSAEELVEGAARLKGHAANLDVKCLMMDMGEIMENLKELLASPEAHAWTNHRRKLDEELNLPAARAVAPLADKPSQQVEEPL